MPLPLHILLADHHAAIRMGVRALVLSLWPQVRVVEVSDGQTLGKELRGREWDLVVLDQTMPGGSGLELLLEGLGPKDIAARLGVTSSSVQTHIARLLTKLELKTTRDLFRWAAARGAL